MMSPPTVVGASLASSSALVSRTAIGSETTRRPCELGRDSRDRRRNARLRVHGQGALERLPQDRLHDLAAAAHAAARRDRGSERRGGRAKPRRATASSVDDRLAGPRVRSAIGLFDNLGPNSLHAEPTIAAAEAGKHVVCEKPLGRDADESYEIWQRVAATGVKHLCAFNYRFVPAVRLARELIDAGELGEIRHFRGRYLQDWGDTDAEVWRFEPRRRRARARSATSRPRRRSRPLPRRRDRRGRRLLRTFIPGREVDDAVEATVEFANGAVGTIEATRLALGRRNAFQWEINGTEGLARVRHGASERAAGLPRRRRPRRAGSRTSSSRRRPSVLGALVAAGAHHRLGRDVRPRAPPLPRARSPTTPMSHRTGRPSRTATARPRCAMRSSAPANPGRRETVVYRTP